MHPAVPVCILLLTSLLAGQTIDEENNWYKETERGDNWYTRFDYTRYGKEDVSIAKTKYLKITKRLDLDEWEGDYGKSTMLGAAELTWSLRDGYVEAYSYHTLAALDHGKVISNKDDILLYSEKLKTSSRSGIEKLIKVKFGDLHLLIPQSKLLHFAKRAAGIISNPDENDYFWVKKTDEHKKVIGLPIFPKRFSRLVMRPIAMRIVSIGKPKLRQDKFENGEVYAEYHNRRVSLDAGLRKGVRIGMYVYATDLDEWIQIIRVGRTTSVGILSRSLLKSGQEACYEEDDLREKERPCLALKSGVSVKTLSREFNF